MACCCSSPTRTVVDDVDNPCIQCGPYGRVCCFKLTSEGETWLFRHSGETAGSRPVPEYYVDGDTCFERDNSNLCGTMFTCGPCSQMGRWLDPFGFTEDRIHTITWRVADDCSEVLVKIYYVEEDGATVTRYEAAVSTDWLNTELPLTLGPFTLSGCEYYEPIPKQVNICCWQMTFEAYGITEIGVSSRTVTDAEIADRETCLARDPRLNVKPTEQCATVVGLSLNPTSDPSTTIRYVDREFPIFGYLLSEDYSVIRWHFKAAAWEGLLTGPGGVPITDYFWDETGEIPFTSDWFLTPIVLPATTARSGLDPADATITISVCGYEVVIPPEDPCYDVDLYPLFVDIEDVAGLVDGGTYAMTWDGFEYASGYTPATTDYQVQIRFKKNPGTHGPCLSPEAIVWDVFFDLWDVALDEFVETQTIQNICILCGGEPPISGDVAGGTGTVDATDVDFMIHD